jgi:putative membrane protein
VLIAAIVVAVLAVLFHAMAFVFESVLWTRPEVFARFGIGSAEEAETIKVMAYNQGFYNLALAVGVTVGLVLLTRSGDAFVAGKAIAIFGTACMTVAGVALASSGRSYLRSASIQFGLSALALILIIAV